MSDSLTVWYDQRRAGRLIVTHNRQMAFSYDGDWLTDGWPISCSLPLEETGDFVPPDMRGHHFFSNLLPEGGARDRLVRKLGIADDDFLLLKKLGGDCAGALQLLPEDASAATLTDSVQPLDNTRLLEAIRKGHAQWLDGDDPPRLSLAGAQDKLAVRAEQRDGQWRFFLPDAGSASTHILKLPVRDLRQVPLFEAYTTFLAQKLQLPVAPVELITLEDEVLSISRRYDRTEKNGTVVRLHQEDLCQAQGLSHVAKYRQSQNAFSPMAELLREHSVQPALDLQALVNWQIFNALAGNADGHLKNLSLLAVGGGGWKLAPWYDLVCTLAISKVSHHMALPVHGKTDPQNLHKNHWEGFAEDLGVSTRLVQRLIRAQAEQLCENADQWLEEFQERYGALPALRSVQDVVSRQSTKALRDWV